MQIEAFKRIVTTFADPLTELLFEKNRTMIQVYGDVIEVSVRQRAGEVFVLDLGNEVPAVQWILTRLARLPLLADRLLSTVPVTEPFVIPEGDILESFEISPREEPENVRNALDATLNALDNRSPLETTVMYITSDAGEGKTCLINEMARRQAARFKDHSSDWLLVPIPLGGRHFLRFDDITVGAIQNRYRFPYLYYDAFLELVRLGILIPAFDGFEEMFVESGTGEAFSAMGVLVNSLQSSGAVVVAARKAYFEFQNLRSQARLYDTIGTFDVGFAKLMLHRWKQSQFLDYCNARGLTAPERLYSKAVDRLGPEHPLITRPVLVRRLVDIAEGSSSLDEFLTKLNGSGPDFFSVFVREFLEREVTEKWIDRSGDPLQPLLSVEEHCQLLSLIALEMWQSRVDFLKTDNVEFVTDYFSEKTQRPSGSAAQIRERIKGHALLIASGNVRDAMEFDHDEFRQFFLGEAIAELCLAHKGASHSGLLNALRKGVLPEQTISSAIQALTRLGTNQRRPIASTLAEIALLDGQTSFTHENCASLILALLTGEEGIEITLHRILFSPNSLRDKKLTAVSFEGCFFADSSLENAKLQNCRFTQCEFNRVEIFDSTIVQNTLMTDCEIDSLWVSARNSASYDPEAINAQLCRVGFSLSLPAGLAETGETYVQEEREEGVVQVERILRYFARSTHMSESLIKMKLGGRSNTFFAEYLPVLLQRGILSEIENTGAGQQRRFRLGRSMARMTRSIEDCGGSFERFISAASS